MVTGPTEQELRAFVEAMLSNLDKRLREPEVIDETILEHREMWTSLYVASLKFDVKPPASDSPSASA